MTALAGWSSSKCILTVKLNFGTFDSIFRVPPVLNMKLKEGCFLHFKVVHRDQSRRVCDLPISLSGDWNVHFLLSHCEVSSPAFGCSSL